MKICVLAIAGLFAEAAPGTLTVVPLLGGIETNIKVDLPHRGPQVGGGFAFFVNAGLATLGLGKGGSHT